MTYTCPYCYNEASKAVGCLTSGCPFNVSKFHEREVTVNDDTNVLKDPYELIRDLTKRVEELERRSRWGM